MENTPHYAVMKMQIEPQDESWVEFAARARNVRMFLEMQKIVMATPPGEAAEQSQGMLQRKEWS